MSTTSHLNSKIKILRPLLNESKKSNFISKVFGTYVKDPSNNNKKFLRSNIRKLLPILKKHGIRDDQIIKSINNLKSSSKTLNTYFEQVFRKVVKRKGKSVSIKSYDLFSLNEELQIRILGFVIKSLNKLDYPPRSKKILTALEFLASFRGKKYQLGGCLLINSNKYINVEKSL